ncbi:hypothetical protein P12x_002185 [Tundrisphaera lichenicola]|uniref:hypothetical protein n=1 Tax=Tundrisphaera lichenicola TaxID=2029860 RepID=UPI003EBF02D3
MLPPIRYPLPSLVALVLVGLLVWKGAEWSSDWRAEMAVRARRVLEGPPVPSSPRPRVVAGPIIRRALLLRDETPVTGRPNGPTSETIDRRMFVDVYDTWPEPGPPTHVRIGNRRPIGWVSIADVLPWDTRLVVRAPGGRLSIGESPEGPTRSVTVGDGSLPVLAMEGQAVQVAVWEPGQPWSAVARSGWVRLDDLPAGSWGVWISQFELPILLRLAFDRQADPSLIRLRTVLGRLADAIPLTIEDLDAAKPALPALLFDRESNLPNTAARLAQANLDAESEASWSGLRFRFLPLSDLP